MPGRTQSRSRARASDPARAAGADVLARALAPYASLTVVIGSALYYGPVSYFLGLLTQATTRGSPVRRWPAPRAARARRNGGPPQGAKPRPRSNGARAAKAWSISRPTPARSRSRSGEPLQLRRALAQELRPAEQVTRDR